ncbi:MAG: GTPase [Planctomycetaceae bacterium]
MPASLPDPVAPASCQPLAEARRLTADCPGAVAVIELKLSDTTDDVLPFFRNFTPRSRSVSLSLLNRIVYGQWRDEDVVVVRTDGCRWEIHCHGGRAAISQILHDLRAAGAVADEQSSTAPRTDSSDAFDADDEAVVERVISQSLQSCRTLEAARWILRQNDGRLVTFRRSLSSEDPRIRNAARALACRWKSFAQHLTEPFRIALVGVPNAGKSSLMNAIAGKQRAIVSEIPGTTRDVLEADIVFDGWMFRLADTAGIRQSTSTLEHFGIQRAITMMSAVDLICVVVDRADSRVDEQLIQQLQSATASRILVWNKADLGDDAVAAAAGEMRDQVRQSLSAVDEVEVSALTGDGVNQLLSVIAKSLVPEVPDVHCPLPLPGLWEDGDNSLAVAEQ